MQGLEAINAANGWAMAYTGAAIVVTGLAVLALIISQLHRIVVMMEKPDDQKATAPAAPAESPAMGIDELDLMDSENAAAAYQQLTQDLEEPFPLASLYALTKAHDLPHSHLTIKGLRENGLLVARGEGLFGWKGAEVAETEPPEALQPEPALPDPPAAPEAPAPAPPEPTAPAAAPEPATASSESVEPETDPVPAAPAPAEDLGGTPLIAPMPGMIVRYEKSQGDAVSEGETVVVLEAMKMENALPAPVSGTITSIGFASGDSVPKEAVLCVIG